MSHIADDQFEVHMAVNVSYLVLWWGQYFYCIYFIKYTSEDSKYS